jgi:hypothetical protein
MLPEPLRVEAEHVSFCFLISALVAPPPEQLGWAAGFDGATAQRLLAVFLLEEIQDVSSPTLIRLPVLITRLQEQLGDAGTVLARAVVTSLNVLEAPDDITNFLQGCSSLLAPAGATPTVATDASSIAFITNSSPLGLFVRRVRLGLSAMTVQALASLCARIQQQLSTLDAELQATQPGGLPCTGRSSASAVAGQGPQGAASTAFKEQAVLEAYLNNLLAAVEAQGQSLPASTVAAASRPLAELQSQLPKLQYLQMAVHLAHKDMHAALASLHQYFDSSGSSTAVGASLAAGSTPGGSAVAGSSAAADAAGRRGRPGNRGRGGCHQSALHSLSALHAALGHPQEALAALQELLRVGQQQGDEWGLLHALAGLCRVMGMSEGLSVARSSSSNGRWPSVAAAGSLDLRQTEQQLQLQALLRRCLDTAKDLRVPHIAAFAAVSLCRFQLQHASSDTAVSSSGRAGPAAGAAAMNGAPQDHSTAAGSGSLMVQRLLLDVATLEHQAAIAAAAPSPPAGSAAADAVGAAVQGSGMAVPPQSSDLYNPPEAFGLDASGTPPGAVPASHTTSSKPAVGKGWRAAVAGVRQAMGTAQLVAAAAMQLQGASSLAAVKLLTLLTSPGGGGGTSGTRQLAGASDDDLIEQQWQQQQQGSPNVVLPRQCSITGCSISYDDLANCWALLVTHVCEVQGVRAAERALFCATSHFPAAAPPQLVAVQQQLALHKAMHLRDLPAAHLACQELQSLVQPLPHLDLQLQLAAAEADAELKAASGAWQQAHTAAATLFNVAAAAAMQPQAVKALLLMGRAAMGAGDIAGSLPCGLSAFLHCQQLQLDGLLPEAVLLLAAAWQGLAPGGGLDFVQQLLQQVLPLGLATKSLKSRGDLGAGMAKLQLAKLHEESAAAAAAAAATIEHTACRSTAVRGPHIGQQQQQQLAAAAMWLEDAAAGYEQAGLWPQACELLVMLSHVMNVLGDAAARNKAAARWQAAQQLLVAPD